MVGEKESWSSSNTNNKSSCSKQWTNISTNNSINNQNLQYNIISNPSIDVESQQNTISFPIHRLMLSHNNQSSMQSKAKWQPNSLHFQLFVILNRFTHRFKYLDCLNLECILDICLFTHIELYFYSINPNSNLVNVVSRIDRLDAFTDPW